MSGQANGAFIVTKYGCGWLGIANVFEGVAFGDAELGVGICPSEFCFGSRTHFDRYAGGKAFNGGVYEVGAVIAECVVSSGFRSGVGKGEVGGVGVDGEEHFGGTDDTVMAGIFSKIAQEAFLGGDDGGSGFRLERGECGDGLEDGDVVGSGVV